MMAAVSDARATGAEPLPSFEEVYAACFDAVWRLAAHRVPAASIDDVVQEVFLVVHRRLPSFEGRSTVRTWVIGIARNVIRDHLRKVGHRPIGTPLDHEPVDGAPSAAEMLDRKAALAVLDEALARMSEDQKEAFLLVEMEQLSSREAAEVLETNDNTVRTRLRAARGIFSAAVTRFRARQRWGSDHG